MSSIYYLRLTVILLMFYSSTGYRNDGPPTLLVRPESKTAPVDTAVVLFCRADGNPLPNLMWLSNGHIITDSRYKIKTLPDALSILRIEPVKLSDANQTLSCTAENGIGSPIKAEASITVLSKENTPLGFPVIETHPEVKTVEIGRTSHLFCRVRGNPTPKVLWLKNSNPVDVRTNTRYSVSTMGSPGALMIQKATEEDQGKYECVASNEHGVVHSKAVHLFVKERQIPPYFSVKLPPLHKVITGATVNLTCVAVGFPMPRVFWRRQSDGLILNDPLTAPIGRNVLTVRDVREPETYKCLAVSKLGNIAAITQIEPDGPYIPIPAPENVRVTDVNTTAITLRWDTLKIQEPLIKIIVKYRIKFNDGPETEMDFYNVDNELTVGNLQNFQHYEFTLIAEVQSGKRSPPSLPIEAHTSEKKAQSPPTNIQLRSLRDGAVLVEWTPAEEGEQGEVTGYKIIYTDVGEDLNEDEWRQKQIGNRDPATTLISLDTKRPVFVKIKALTSQDKESEWSKMVRLDPKSENVPSAPQNLDVIQYNATTYKVTWTAPEQSNGQIFGYYVYQDKLVNGQPTPNGRRKAAALMDKDASSVLISDFEPNTEYVLRVNAFNQNGDGEYATSKNFLTGRSAPQPPRVQSVTLVDENQPLRARVEWLAPVDKSDGSTAPVQQYFIWYGPVGGDMAQWQKLEVDGSSRGVLLDDLMMGTEYEIQLASWNEDGQSDNSTERLNTPVGRPTGIPLNVQYSLSEDKIFFQWDAPEVSKRNGPIIGYHPVLSCNDNSQPRHQNVSRQWTTFSIDPKKSYGFRVAANTARGSGPYSEQIRIKPSDSALVGPPANVTVQALSNDSVVVQWDFDEQLNGGLADGFVVKFIHEPGRTDHSSQNMDLWKAQTVMDPKARHMEISRLTAHKPYAFCVLAIKNSRLGPCSDPPTTIDKIFPNRVVQNLRALYKTSQSVNLHWDFNDGGDSRLSGQKLSFYIKQSGMKTYRTQFLKEETLNAPGFERRIDGAERTFLWSNLRPYMNYTFKVGVYSNDDGRTYWPREITVRTDPTGPPLVDVPEFLQSQSYGTAQIRIKCATEEHGPISHYWLVVIPGNYSKDHVINVDSQQLVHNTNRVRQLYNKNPTITAIEGKNNQRRALSSSHSSKEVQEGKIDLHVYANGHQVENPDDEDDWEDAHESLSRSKREVSEDSGIEADKSIPKLHVKHHKRKRRHNTKKKREPAAPLNLPLIDGVYISAQLSAQQVEQMQRRDEPFVLGDGKEYGGFLNIPLDINNKYRVMSRAFASDQGSLRFDQPFQYRAPMTEPASKLFTDSMISEPFASKPPLVQRFASKTSSLWFIAPITVIFILILLVGMLIIYFLKCRRKTLGGSGPFSLQNGGNTMQRRHGSITKIALGTDFAQLNGNGNGIYGPRTTTLPNETSKLLANGNGTHTANGTLNRSDLNGHAHFGSSTQSQPLYDLYQPNGAPPGTLSISQNNLNDGPNQLNDLYHQHQYNSQQRRPNGGLQLGIVNGKFGASHTPIPLNEFPAHVEHLKQNNNELFIKEFESIETDQHFTWEHSNLEVNKPKNRYANIVAYDHSRVVLTPVSRSAAGGPQRMRGGNLLDDLADDLGGLGREDDDEEPGSDYINANYIDGFYKPRAYIATQGPLPETFADFWRMVWEERSAVVVMLTKLEERSRVKCSQYWPSRNSATYGHIVVTVLDTVELAHYTIRTMRLEHLVERKEREIKHTQYTSWPDHGVPDHPTPFLMFLKKVKALNPAGSGAIVTHCSAGVGRTGALIAIDCMVERIYAENTVDIYGCVKALRTQRMYMVQTEEQYIFIHDAVLDAAQSGSTEVPAVKLKQHIETNIHAITQGKATGLDVEFQSLVALRPPNASFHAAMQPVNLAKNRQPDQLPYDNNRVILQRINDIDGSDFINASWIDSYQHRRAYIATQNPMADTVIDFWRMLWENDACVVVMLTGKPMPNGQMSERYAEYWPLNGPLRYGQLLVELISEYEFDNYIMHELKIAHVNSNESRTIRHFQFLNWPDRGNQNIEDLNGFIQAVHTTRKQFGLDGPICVHCSNGAGRTGVFIAIATIIERIHLEQVVDVFTTVKLLRSQRPNMVETKAELELVYDAAMTYLNYYFPAQNDHLMR